MRQIPLTIADLDSRLARATQDSQAAASTRCQLFKSDIEAKHHEQ